MRSLITLALLLLIAAVAIAAPNAHSAAAGTLDARGTALLLICVVVIAVETVRRLP